MTRPRRMPSRRKRILVTGGAGFLGSLLCERLLAAGARCPLRRQFLHRDARQSRICSDHPRFELLRHDITFPLYVEVDEIYNLACPASPVHYQHDPVQTTKTSVHGAINMLGLAKRLSAKIFQASTSRGLRRSRRPPAARRAIGATSIRSARAPAMTRASAAPRLCSSTISASTACAIKVARIFNTYGPRMHPDDGRVVSNFIMQALSGEPITIYGDGQQTRSLLLCRRSDRRARSA